MLYKLHYWFFASGLNAIGILLGVFLQTYSDASAIEIGTMFMILPFVQIFTKPLICSRADRRQAHQKYLMANLLIMALAYSPYLVIPFLGDQFHQEHGRLCWYLLVVFKVIGTIAIGAASSIGDSLAINYAKRIGTKFSVYRIWTVISWLTFGLIVGHINEMPQVPKYVPGFAILVIATSIDTLIVYLWPPDYFRMVAIEQENEDEEDKKKEKPQSAKVTGLASMTHSLMPKEVVWAHAKKQLSRLVTCSCLSNTRSSWQSRQNAGLDTTKAVVDTEMQLSIDSASPSPVPERPEPIPFKLQMTILSLIVRRDPRVILYLCMFVVAGFVLSPMNFFFMNLSAICNEEGTCNFSNLAGYLQASMASIEFCVFFYIEDIIQRLGRLNVITFGFMLISLKYLFYGTLWRSINPHYSLLVECVQGVMYSICVTIQVNVGHMFANEVALILPEVRRRGLIKDQEEADRVKLSLSATMQALFSIAFDCIGHSIGALVFGFIISRHSYQPVWLLVSAVSGITCLIIIVVNLFNVIVKPNLGIKPETKECANGESEGESNP